MTSPTHLARLAGAALRRPGLVVLLAGVVLTGGIASVVRLSRNLDTDSLALLPNDLPDIAALRDALAEFGASDRVYLLARPHSAGDDEAVVETLDQLAAELPPSLVRDATATFPFADVYRRHLLPNLPLFLGSEGTRELTERLTPERMAVALASTRRRLRLPMSNQDRELLTLDPLALYDLLRRGPQPPETGVTIDPTTGGLRTARGAHLMIVRPRKPATDIPFDQELSAAMDRLVAVAAERHPDLEVRWGGAHLTALSDYRLMITDLNLNLPASAVAVALLFLVGFRSFRALGIAFAPLVVGILTIFLLVDLSGLRLTSATMGFGAMLIGLGIDLCIVFIGRFGYAVHRLPRRAALDDASGSTLTGIATGAITTAVAFSALLASGFPGLRQLGLITAVGILACLLWVVLLLPVLLHRFGYAQRPIRGFGLTFLPRIALRYPVATLAVAATVTLGLALGLPRLKLEDDLESLRSPHNPGIDFDQTLAQELGKGADSLFVLVRSSNLNALEERLDRAQEALEGLQSAGLVAGAQGVRSLIPPSSLQADAISELARLGADLSPQRFRHDFQQTLIQQGFRPEAFDDYADAIASALSLDQPLTLDDVLHQPLLSGLMGDQVSRNGSRLATQIVVDPAPGVSPTEVRRAFRARLGEADDESIIMTGFEFAAQELRHQIRRDSLWVVPLGSLLVILFLWLDLRRFRSVVLALLPTVLGITWMLGAMGLLGQTFNFFNLFVLALIQGIGVDYGVHLIHRIEESGLDPDQLADIGGGLVLAALTTVAGFGSLGLSNYPALSSMGIVTTLGAAGSLLAALTTIPAASALLSSRRGETS